MAQADRPARLAATAAPDALLIAETGGLNAMIVDSTALPEQAVRDILASAFQTAGQRCSALRVLYVQEDVAERCSRCSKGAMDELQCRRSLGSATDVGPVIDDEAEQAISAYVAEMAAKGAGARNSCRRRAGGRFVAAVGVSR